MFLFASITRPRKAEGKNRKHKSKGNTLTDSRRRATARLKRLHLRCLILNPHNASAGMREVLKALSSHDTLHVDTIS